MGDTPKKPKPIPKTTEIVVKRRRKRNPVSVEERAYLGNSSLKLLKLREAGYTWEEAAKEIDTTVPKAKDLLTKFLSKINENVIETWDVVRKIEHAELASIEVFLWECIKGLENTNEIIKVIDRLLKTKQIKYQLLGLNAVEQLEITHKLPQINTSLPAGIVLNENKLKDNVITIQDSSDELLNEE